MDRARRGLAVAGVAWVVGAGCLLASGCGDGDSGSGPDGGELACVSDSDRIFADVAYLASDELAGRYPGTAGNEDALVMAEQRFVTLGLEPAGDDGTYRQAFSLDVWQQNETPSLEVDGLVLDANQEFILLRDSVSGALTAEVVFAGYGMTVPAFDSSSYPGCPLPSARDRL